MRGTTSKIGILGLPASPRGYHVRALRKRRIPGERERIVQSAAVDGAVG